MSRSAKLALLCVLATVPVVVQAEWREASSRHFVIYSEDKPEALQAFAERLERYDQAMRYIKQLADPDLGPANRLNVFVVRNINAVQRLAGSGSSNVAGFYAARTSGSLPGSMAVVPRQNDGISAQSVLFHEYAHHFVSSNYSVAWPAWLSEGFAEFHATTEIRNDGSVDIGRVPLHHADSLTSLGQISVTRMMGLTTDAENAFEVGSLYARGWALVHYLTFEPTRNGQLGKYVGGLDMVGSSLDHATAVFGDLEKLDGELNRYLQRQQLRAVRVPGNALKVGAIELRVLPPGEQAVIDLRVRTKLLSDRKDALELAPEVRKVAARFADNAIVQALLADVEYYAGDPAAAAAAADRALAANPKLVSAHLLKGRARMAIAMQAKDAEAETWQAIRNSFLSANRIDPEDPAPLVLFYKSFINRGEAVSANAVAGLNRAQELAPQDRSLRMISAYQYLVDGKTSPARRLLTLIASDPHDRERGKAAGAIIAKLDQPDGGTAGALQLFRAEDLVW